MSDVLKLSLEDISFLMELEKSGVVLKAGSVFNMSPPNSRLIVLNVRISEVWKYPTRLGHPWPFY